jgi:outer membrane lipoprotein-sorting protein
VSDLGQLLQVIHDSRSRWRTFRGEYRLWRHRERSHEAFIEMAKRSGGTTYGGLALARKGDPPPPESEGRWLIWVERPDSAREEFEGTAWGTRTVVKVGERWWAYDEYGGARSNEGEEDVGIDVGRFSGWLEPAKLLGSLRFKPMGTTEVAGRAALRALATLPDEPSLDDDDHRDWELHMLGAEAEEYELAVDQEMGTLLRVEARFGGQPTLIGEAEVVAFDEDFPPETFVFTPPEGEEIQPFERPLPSGDQPIHEAAAEAPFMVFMLPRIPEGWSMTAFSFPESKRPKRGHIVGVSYRAESGAAGLSLSQRAHSDDEEDEYEDAEMETVEHRGLSMQVQDRTDDLPQSVVLVTRDGTDLTITSEELSGEKLIEVAVDLVPAPTEPPEL